ncbi:MAG: nucleotide exchange factor GrpE [Acidimicrobiia bacterium]|nr:nucleotide exchange factor GrpE [Acidimicrobiia bacterium]MDH3396388.1 nucleotide exchange factor GrpE [Acidimicrobiia bacterium]
MSEPNDVSAQPGSDEIVVAEEPRSIDPHTLGLELPGDAAGAIQLLLGELDAAREEAGSYLADLQRVAADFDNFRKRMLRDQVENIERASQRVVIGLMPTLDTLEAALTTEAETPAEKKLLDGVRGTLNLLLDTLGKEGLETVPTVGSEFNPELHEAVLAPEPASGRLIVTQEMRRGYTLRGRLLRAALVAVDHE